MDFAPQPWLLIPLRDVDIGITTDMIRSIGRCSSITVFLCTGTGIDERIKNIVEGSAEVAVSWHRFHEPDALLAHLQSLDRSAPLLIVDILGCFWGTTVPLAARMQSLDGCIAQLDALSDVSHIIVTAAFRKNMNRELELMLEHLRQRAPIVQTDIPPLYMGRWSISGGVGLP